MFEIKKLFLLETTVIFGCRNKEHDFYFRDEWPQLPITFFSAFSRDQEEKVYVQDIIRENQEVLWSMISEQDAAIFVAGYVAHVCLATLRLSLS